MMEFYLRAFLDDYQSTFGWLQLAATFVACYYSFKYWIMQD